MCEPVSDSTSQAFIDASNAFNTAATALSNTSAGYLMTAELFEPSSPTALDLISASNTFADVSRLFLKASNTFACVTNDDPDSASPHDAFNISYHAFAAASHAFYCAKNVALTSVMLPNAFDAISHAFIISAHTFAIVSDYSHVLDIFATSIISFRHELKFLEENNSNCSKNQDITTL